MSAFTPLTIAVVLFALIAVAFISYVLGTKRSRLQRRILQTDLNRQSLELLDIKADLAKLEKKRDQFARKDRVLKLTLRRLASVTALTRDFDHHKRKTERKHFMEVSRLQVAAAEARQQALRAAKVATTKSKQLKKLETLYTQTINAPSPKSYGQGDSVKVSVVDQHAANVSKESVARVSNRDLRRLSKMQSSNEGQVFSADSLQAIAGISPSLEQTLNRVGIHHIEQLASISDRELIELPIPRTEAASVATRANWKSGAKQWLQHRSNG